MKKSIVRKWEWITAGILAVVGTSIIVLNESLDLLIKAGIQVTYGTSTFIFFSIAVIGCVWWLLNILRHTEMV